MVGGNASTIDTYFFLSANTGENSPSPCVAAERGYVDAVIQPTDTRPRTTAPLEVLHGKRQESTPPKKQKISYTSGTFH
jgi:acetyl-CoA carboxylase carboxyltransferase component